MNVFVAPSIELVLLPFALHAVFVLARASSAAFLAVATILAATGTANA